MSSPEILQVPASLSFQDGDEDKKHAILHVRPASETEESSGNEEDKVDATTKEDALSNIKHSAIFNTGRTLKQKTRNQADKSNKTRQTLRAIGWNIAHPKSAIKKQAKKKTAKQLSDVQRPCLSKDADLEYLEAHEDLRRAEDRHDSASAEADINEEHDRLIENQRGKIEEMEKYRETMQVVWTTSRHVHRVRVVPKGQIAFPSTDQFALWDSNEHVAPFEWLRWFGHYLVYFTQDFTAQYLAEPEDLSFDQDAMRHCIERILTASGPLQAYLMSARSLSRWDNPRRTAKWFAIYLVCWYSNHIVSFLYAYILYIVLRNRFQPHSVESLQTSMQRTRDAQSKSHKIRELMDRHGDSDWVEPLIEDIGPRMQLQLGDAADFLEILYNFYSWKSPRKTWATLAFFTVCLLISLFADMAYCMKIVWFIVGGNFFLCFPIASHYPKYRFLVSSLRWVFWDIPTLPEWSFQYLRRQAQEDRERLIEQKIEEVHTHESSAGLLEAHHDHSGSSLKSMVPNDETSSDTSDSSSGSDATSFQSVSSASSILDSTDLRSFRAYSSGGHVGHLIVYTDGIRFVRSRLIPRGEPEDPGRELWRCTFQSLVELRKFNDKDGGSSAATAGRVMKFLSSSRAVASGKGGGLAMSCTDGQERTLRGMVERDEAFNTIIAFSGLQWQNLRAKRHGMEDRKDD